MKPQNKYGNRKTATGDSAKERRRLAELKLMERAGAISDLKCQVKFELIPKQENSDGKCIERACSYIADFTYYQCGAFVVEDVKGFRTPEYIIKRKLMLYRYGIVIKET